MVHDWLLLIGPGTAQAYWPTLSQSGWLVTPTKQPVLVSGLACHVRHSLLRDVPRFIYGCLGLRVIQGALHATRALRMVKLIMLSPILPKSVDTDVCTLAAHAAGF